MSKRKAKNRVPLDGGVVLKLDMTINGSDSDDRPVLREVPATMEFPSGRKPEEGDEIFTSESGVVKLVIGVARLYTDGTVNVEMKDDLPEWAQNHVRGNAAANGFSIGRSE